MLVIIAESMQSINCENAMPALLLSNKKQNKLVSYLIELYNSCSNYSVNSYDFILISNKTIIDRHEK